jgi:hypothetical protein
MTTQDEGEEALDSLDDHHTELDIDQVGCIVITTAAKNMMTRMMKMTRVTLKSTTQCVDDGQGISCFI